MEDHSFREDFCSTDVHDFFGLTYASYLTVPRSVLQSMPAVWQHKFSLLMDELTDLYGGYDMDYRVNAVDSRGKFKSDPLRNYERGRRRVPPKEWSLSDSGELKGGE